MQLTQLCEFCDDYLKAAEFSDYCPNGLQVEANPRVESIVCGVTASQALIDAAVVEQADAILVHHGYFWKNEDARVRGMKKQRLQPLLRHDIWGSSRGISPAATTGPVR